MAPVMTRTNMPTTVALPWKIRSDRLEPGDELARLPIGTGRG